PVFFFFQREDGIRDFHVTGVQTCALPISSIGGIDEETGSALFNRPNGVAIGPDGNLYVADTWNYRIVVLTQDGEVITSWGQPGQFGIEAAPAPFDAFWGPRDVEVDEQGRVYVADTGNKRIRVYKIGRAHV